MDRVAFQNMTTKTKNNFTNCIEPEKLSRPVGEMTSKTKINTHINNYFSERQSKNANEYDRFVLSLDNNIFEDQFRTNVNNDVISNKQQPSDNLQHIYHPSLNSDRPFNTDTDFERIGMSTRDRQVNTIAKNKNTSGSLNIQPPAKLNYPQGYNQLQPLKMDMTSQIDTQFVSLTNTEMEKQLSLLSQKEQSSNQTNQLNSPNALQLQYNGHFQLQSQFNPQTHANYQSLTPNNPPKISRQETCITHNPKINLKPPKY